MVYDHRHSLAFLSFLCIDVSITPAVYEHPYFTLRHLPAIPPHLLVMLYDTLLAAIYISHFLYPLPTFPSEVLQIIG